MIRGQGNAAEDVGAMFIVTVAQCDRPDDTSGKGTPEALDNWKIKGLARKGG